MSVATILIVDDEEPIRELMAMVLESDGHRVLLAMHGKQALALVEQQRMDLVISDVMMPVLDGIELCHRLKAMSDTPIILMSAAGRQIVDGTPADAFMAKPFDLYAMEELIAGFLHR